MPRKKSYTVSEQRPGVWEYTMMGAAGVGYPTRELAEKAARKVIAERKKKLASKPSN